MSRTSANLSLEKHIAKMFRVVCVSILNIGMMRKHINQPVAEILTHALITSRLDTCNSLLHDLNKTQVNDSGDYKTLRPDLSRSPGNSLTPHLSSNKYTGYQSTRNSPSKCPCLYSRQSTVSRLLTCVALLYHTIHFVEICTLQTSCY